MSVCRDCGKLCMCRVLGSTCISVGGNGDATTPYQLGLIIGAAGAASGLTCDADGLNLTVPCTRIVACETPWTGHSDSPNIVITPGGVNGHDPLFSFVAPPETPFEGVPSGLVTITPGGTVGHAPTIGVSCEDVQDCVGPMLGQLTGWDYDDAGNRWVTTGQPGQIAFINAAGDMSWENPDAGGLETPNSTTNANPGVTVSLSGPFNRNIEVSVSQTPPPVIVPPGCGLVATGGFNGLRVNTSGIWNYPCPTTSGSPIFCDANGQLRGVPEKFCVNTGRLGAFDTPAGPVSGGNIQGACITATLNNPSPCLPMQVNYIDTTAAGGDLTGFWNGGRGAVRFVANNFGAVPPGDYAFWSGNPSAGRNQGSATGQFILNGSNNDIGVVAAGSPAVIQTCGAIYVDAGTLGAPGIQHTVTLSACNV